jgi:hypothetical protein
LKNFQCSCERFSARPSKGKADLINSQPLPRVDRTSRHLPPAFVPPLPPSKSVPPRATVYERSIFRPNLTLPSSRTADSASRLARPASPVALIFTIQIDKLTFKIGDTILRHEMCLQCLHFPAGRRNVFDFNAFRPIVFRRRPVCACLRCLQLVRPTRRFSPVAAAHPVRRPVARAHRRPRRP